MVAQPTPVGQPGLPRRLLPPHNDESKNPVIASTAKQSRQRGYGHGGQTRRSGRFWIATSAMASSQ